VDAVSGNEPPFIAEVDRIAARNIIGEFMDDYSDEPFNSADALVLTLWDGGYAIVPKDASDG
jgi:hypothetical protein